MLQLHVWGGSWKNVVNAEEGDPDQSSRCKKSMVEIKASSNQNASINKKNWPMGGGQALCLLLSTAGSITVKEALHTSHNSQGQSTHIVAASVTTVPILVGNFPILEKGSTKFRWVCLERKKGWLPNPGKGFYPAPRNWKQYGSYTK
jgi:hypothetical protein